MRAIRSSLLCFATALVVRHALGLDVDASEAAASSCSSCDEAETLKVELVQTKVQLQRGVNPGAVDLGLELLDLGTSRADLIAAVERLEHRVRAVERRLQDGAVAAVAVWKWT
mmetsp:Transcript_49805/g.79382  ORF Transcript_49805/g.79382 Transcript_49805/m.79382 type:complete len:113 (+) Transcript_49805:66-404(+)